MMKNRLLTEEERAKALRELHRRMKQYDGCSHTMEFEAVEAAQDAKSIQLNNRQWIEEIENKMKTELAANNTILAYRIFPSDWQALKKKMEKQDDKTT